ncbi:MAG: acyl-CoA thioesterase [Ilumatobacter sp.]
MAGLERATSVTHTGEGRYVAELDPEWEIWGPQGGYLAAVALRAAGAATGRARPASVAAHFVGAGTSGPVEIDVVTNRETRVATSVSFRVVQHSERGERAILTGSAWGVDDGLPGLEHGVEPPVEPFTPDGLPDIRELLAGADAPPPHPFWLNVEQRPLAWIDDWDAREPGEPRQQHWYRFVDGATFDEPWLDACRGLVVLDVDSWGSATRAHPSPLEHFAPTIELAVRFVGDGRGSPWLFSDARAPVAANGLVAHAGEIWAADGRIVATGGSTLLCRPVARRPDGR